MPSNGLLSTLRERWFGLPPARNSVRVERDIAVHMPDGVALMTDHYAPDAPGRSPTILIRTPYGRGRDAGIGRIFAALTVPPLAERGYHVVCQTTRGRFDSGGEFVPFLHDRGDGLATLEWIARQPWFDGSVGMWGPSYLGYVQWAVAAGAPPYLKALCPSVVSSNASRIIRPDGTFPLDTILRWTYFVDRFGATRSPPTLSVLWYLARMERAIARAAGHLPLREAERAATGRAVPFYREWLAHASHDDPYWKRLDHASAIGEVTAPVHLVGGWYDLFLRDLLADYAALREAGRSPYLTISPHSHIDIALFGVALREGLGWFDAHLRGDRSSLRRAPVRYYLMGAKEWREAEAWPPPARLTPYFLHGGRRLAREAPGPSAPDPYRYDPADPTPSVGGPLLSRHAGPRDNRALESRRDVLAYTTEPLAADLDVVGPVRLDLYVRSSLPHADFFGRLCDVHPDNRSINLCEGLFRVAPGRGQPQADGTLRLALDLWATANRFRRGHRIRLLVSSGAHPRYSRNLGTGEPLATGTRMAVADQRVFHDPEHPSALLLPVAP